MERGKAPRHREEGGGWNIQPFLILVVLAMMTWGGKELVGIKRAIYGVQTKQLTYDKTDKVVSEMHGAILRIEAQQKKELEDIKVLRENVGN